MLYHDEVAATQQKNLNILFVSWCEHWDEYNQQ